MKKIITLCVITLTLGFFGLAEASLIKYEVSSGGLDEGDQFNGYLILNDEKHITNYDPDNPYSASRITYYVDSFSFTINGTIFAGNDGFLNFEWYVAGESLGDWGYDWYSPIELVSDTGDRIISGSSSDHGEWTHQGPNPYDFVLPDNFLYYASTSRIPGAVYGYGPFNLSNPTIPESPALLLLGMGLVGIGISRNKKLEQLRKNSEKGRT